MIVGDKVAKCLFLVEEARDSRVPVPDTWAQDICTFLMLFMHAARSTSIGADLEGNKEISTASVRGSEAQVALVLVDPVRSAACTRSISISDPSAR